MNIDQKEIEKSRGDKSMVMSKKEKVLKDVVCTCDGAGSIPNSHDAEWTGYIIEEFCHACNGEGTQKVKDSLSNKGFMIVTEPSNEINGFYMIPGDIAFLYVKKGEQYFSWANWFMGSIGKEDEEEIVCYSHVPNLEKFEGNMAAMIEAFYHSDEPHIMCEYTELDGSPYTELEER
jgi:hypothetical protein